MKRYALIAMTLMLLTRCASLVHGRTEDLRIDSTPSGATVVLSCGTSGTFTTPAVVRIPRRADPCTMSVSLDGYATKRVESERGIAPGYWLNLAGALAAPLAIGDGFKHQGAVTGLTILCAGALVWDRINGSMYDHEPRRIMVRLTPTTRRE